MITFMSDSKKQGRAMQEHQQKSAQNDEDGFASLVIGLVLVLVLALLTVGFAQLTRHEQKQALNSQLASQAYYAAESGINDAVQALKAGTAIPNANTNTCVPLPLPGTTSAVINAAVGAEYSCVIVNTETKVLEKTVDPNTAWTVVSDTSSSPDSVTVSWQSLDGQTASCPAAKFSPEDVWNAANCPAVLQFSMTPLGSGVDRNSLITNTFTAYLFPSNTGGSTTYSTAVANQAQIVGGNCTGAGLCSVTVTTPGVSGPFLFHIFDTYDVSDIKISAERGSSPITFNGGQAVIDVTGKARNVLKRLSVRVALDNNQDIVDYTIEAQNVCKRLVTQLNNTTYDDPYGLSSPTNPCKFSVASPNGDAAIGSPGKPCAPNCVGPGGVGAPPGGSYVFTRGFRNNSVNNSPVVSCVWDWGDGTTSTTACQLGETIEHTYKDPGNLPAYPLGCKTIKETVVLTLTLQNGSKPTTTNFPRMPECF